MESEDEQLERLWTDYLEGELDGKGADELRGLLAADESRSQQVTELYRMHRLLGFLAKDNEKTSEHFVKSTISRLPKDSAGFTSEVVRKVFFGQEAEPRANRRNHWGIVWLSVACLALIAGGLFWMNLAPKPRSEIVVVTPAEVTITRLAHAKFFGELSPGVGSRIAIGKDYTLVNGMLELKFHQGAETILEAPAVFRVAEEDLLEIDMGTCSVYAPAGAEGFRVVTPGSTIVDRGTRFSVKVDENSKTEVQMIEGLADIYPIAMDGEEPGSPGMIRLVEKKALQMHNLLEPETSEVPFDFTAYRKRLPDRLVSYEATLSSGGSAEDLASVTVQRGGEEIIYPVDEIIGADVTWFKADDDTSTSYLLTAPREMDSTVEVPEEELCVTRYDYLMAAPGASAPPWTLLADHSLLTGTINPGGSPVPLVTDPITVRDISQEIEGTPGLAIRFHQPIKNSPGPDVVFFELQPVIYPEGDYFHVSPLRFRKGLRSHTIRNYDLSLHSSEALRVTQPHVHFSKDQVAKSLDDLGTMELQTRPTKLIYRAVAVGIDLSDLGYELGDEVEGLFFQDAADDQLHIDPVFIGGLPAR